MLKEQKSIPIYRNLGNALKELRTNKLQMSQRRFAKAIGATQTSVSRWESGERMPMFTLVQIKKLLEEMKAAGLDPIEDFPDLLTDQE